MTDDNDNTQRKQASPRYRRDGWTSARQAEFLDALKEQSSVLAACRQVGKSTTSAYKARERIAGFKARWDAALAAAAPRVIQEAMRRGVEGWDEPVFYKGEVVGTRKRHSDAMLRPLLHHAMRVSPAPGPAPADSPPQVIEHAPQEEVKRPRGWKVKEVPIEEIEEELLRRLAAMKQMRDQEEAEEADRLRAAGLCP
jgi:hypothetical protein